MRDKVHVQQFLEKAFQKGRHGARQMSQNSLGFTLLELILDIALLLILLTFVVILIDPVKQFSKAKDSGRKQDAGQIEAALDTYYNDHGCYPQSVPFGQEWAENGVVYMQKVPQDPDCKTNPGSCYVYETSDSESCPQWEVVYTKQTATPVSQTDCPLKAFPDSCTPSNYDNTWACFIGGSVDCNSIASTPLFVPVPTTTPGIPTPTDAPVFSTPTLPAAGPTATPTPMVACSPEARRYACTGGPPARCNLVSEGSGVYCSSNCNGACL